MKISTLHLPFTASFFLKSLYKKLQGAFAARMLMMVVLCLGAGKGWGQSNHLVISQVYGGGGNASATYNRDFIEIFNPTGATISLTGWSVQYTSAAGTSWTVSSLSGSIGAGKYYLIEEQGGATGAALPTPDLVPSTTFNMSGTAGKLALVSSTTALSGSCPTGGSIVDFIGYGGTASCSETAVATAPSNNTTSMYRASSGCTDANNNSIDFSVASVLPRNSSSTPNFCSPATQALNITSANIQAGQFDFNWTDGSGSKRAVFIKATNTGTASPVNNTTYTANTVFASGTQIGATAWYCVFNGTTHASNITITGLSASTDYRIMVCEYNGTAGAEKYNTATATNNPFNVTTSAAGCTAPSIQASVLSTNSATTSQFNVSWTAGDGNGTMIVIRPTAQSILAPSSGTSYTADPDYSLAGQINGNNRVVFRAAGTTVTPTNLNAGTQYTVTAYEYNNTGDCYNLTSPPSSSIYTLSTEPLAHGASFSATAASPTSINLSFSAASTITNAAGYIILQRQAAAAPTGTPTDATSYSIGNTIGDGTVAAIITTTSSTSTTISGLSPSLQYYYTLIPYNWDGSNNGTYNYYTATTIPSATATTLSLSAPSISSPTATAITSTTATLGGNVTSDGGATVTARGVVWAETSLNSNPTIGGANTNNEVGSGTTGIFTVSATGLPVATQISYAAYATNSQGTTYTSVPTFYTLENQPTTPASVIVFGTVTTGSINLSWTNGNGANRIVVARLAATTRVAPTNANGYSVNSADFTDVLNSQTGTGNIVIYNGTGSSVTVTGLSTLTSYTFDIYEYNGATVTANYSSNISGTKSTLSAEPTTQATAVNFTNVTSTAFKINWTIGNGANSIVLVKDITAVDSDPVDGTTYTANPIFGSGQQIGTGNFVVYKSTAATVTVTGLTDGHTYHVAVYSFNGSGGTENYLLSTPATGSQLATTVNYYSQGSLDPTNLANWNSIRAGGGSTPPAFTDGNFVIQNTHNMTTGTTWSVGASGTTLQIENGGTLTATNAITIASGSTFKIDGGGSYIHDNSAPFGSTIMTGTEDFAATSNFEIKAYNTTGPSGVFGNLTINNTTDQGGSIQFGGNLSTVNGNFTMQNLFSGREVRLSASTSLNLIIAGNLNIQNGILEIASSAGSSVSRSINIGGNYNQTGGTVQSSGTSNRVTINFTGTNKTFIQSAGTLTSTNINWAVNSAASLTLNNNLPVANSRTLTIDGTVTCGTNTISGAGSVTVNSGGTLKVGSTSASGAIAGNITASGGITLNSGSTVEYNGAGAQFAAARTFSNLTINNSAGVTLNENVTAGGTLTMTSGNIDCGANTLELGTSTSTVGTLSYTAGNIIGNFKRWINTPGALRFPVGTAANNMNALVTFTNLTGGSLTARFIASNPGSTGLPLSENSLYISNQFTEGYWSLIAADALASTDYALELTGNGFTSHTQTANTRIIKRAAAGSWSLTGVGTHVAATGATAKRTGLSGFSEFAQADVYIAAISDHFRSITSGDWNVNSTWESSPDGISWYAASSTPDNNANTITVQNTHTVTVTASVTIDQVTVNSGGTVIVNGGQTLTVNDGSGTDLTVDGTVQIAGTVTNNGLAQINNTLQINEGGWPGSTGTYAYGASGTLIFNNSSGPYGPIDAGHVYWPASSGPVNVTIQNGGGINMGVARTVIGTFLLVTGSNAVQGTALTLNGTAQINGGNFQTTPTYGASSTLIYNTTYGTFNEWTGGASVSVAAGSGIPANVTVQSGTVTLSGGRGVPGNITVNTGANMTLNATSGDLYIGGNLTNNGTSWTNNTRAVVFVGTGTSAIAATQNSNTQFFDYLLINKSAGSVQLGASTNVTINSTAGDVLQLLDAGTLDLNGRTLTLNNAGGNILVNGSGRTITSSTAGGIIDITGAKSVTGAGTLTLATTNLTLRTSAGIDFGASKTTLNGTLRLMAGGFVNTNAPTYTSTSTLYYNTGSYSNGSEWGAGGAVGLGVPQHVTVDLSLGSNTVSLDGSRTVPGNLTLTSGAVVIGGGNTLTLNGAISGSGTLTGSSSSNLTLGGAAGTVNFTQTSDATRSIRNITFNSGATATLGNVLDVYGDIEFTPSSSNSFNLDGKHLTLKSNPTYTARIGNLTGSTLGGATNVTVERFFNLRTTGGVGTGNTGRAYRLIAPTVNTTGHPTKPTMKDNWMEGGMNTGLGVINNVNPVPGYGTQITGPGGNSNGFDVTQSNNSSLFATTNAVTPTYTAVPSTGTALNPLTGYFLYFRGDRSMDMTIPLAPGTMPTSSTTLRVTGALLTGDQPSFTNAFVGGAGTLNLVTNPYPSPINWASVFSDGATANITDAYTYWDPNVGNRGGFVTVNTVGGTSTEIPGGTIGGTQFIQSGQAFFIQASGGTAPALTIKETHKAVGDNSVVFIAPPPPIESFRTSLYYIETNNYRQVADGAIAVFGNYNAGVDNHDAFEINNWDENIAISREGKNLAIESRPVILTRDTLPLFMNNMKQRSYEFQFEPSIFTNIGLKAELIDNFMNTRTLLSVVNTTVVPFTVTADPASKATDRFKVVFGTFGGLAVDALTIKAQAKNNGVQVDWTSKTETDMAGYEVERATFGNNFTKLNTTTALGNSSTPVSYSWFDANPNMGTNFYRVKAFDKTGNIKYSDIVKVTFGKGEPGIAVYPNPVEGRTFKMDMNNLVKGTYLLNLYNNMGQLVYTQQLQHDGSQATRTINLKTDIAKGAYQLQLSSDNGFKTTQSIIKN